MNLGLGPLGDLFHSIANQWRQGNEYQNAYDRLVGTGIRGGNFGQQPHSDADRLAYILAYAPNSDATHAQFNALLKQLGYLSRQAQ